MNSNITKRVLITHKLRWYWTISALRKQIREVSEGEKLIHPDEYVQLPMISEDDILKVVALNPAELTSQILAECSLKELAAIYQSVFFNDDRHRIQLTPSPLTDKIGRHVLPYTGMMVVFCLADSLMKSELTATFTELELQRLTWLRWISAKRLHVFTKRLTRIKADNNPTYGMCVTNDEAQIYLVEPGRPGQKEIDLARNTYVGTYPTEWRELVVLPTHMEFRTRQKLSA